MMKTKLLLWLCFLNGQLVYATIETALHDSLSGFPNVRDFAMSESQDEAYFTAQSILGEISVIMRVDKINNQWGKAKIAIFSGQHHDLEPFLSVDGNTLFFSSKRSNDFTEKANYDIWFVNRVDKGSIWSEPKNMGPHIDKVLIVGITPYFLEKGNVWFEENLAKILDARKTQQFFQDNTIYIERDQQKQLAKVKAKAKKA